MYNICIYFHVCVYVSIVKMGAFQLGLPTFTNVPITIKIYMCVITYFSIVRKVLCSIKNVTRLLRRSLLLLWFNKITYFGINMCVHFKFENAEDFFFEIYSFSFLFDFLLKR